MEGTVFNLQSMEESLRIRREKLLHRIIASCVWPRHGGQLSDSWLNDKRRQKLRRSWQWVPTHVNLAVPLADAQGWDESVSPVLWSPCLSNMGLFSFTWVTLMTFQLTVNVQTKRCPRQCYCIDGKHVSFSWFLYVLLGPWNLTLYSMSLESEWKHPNRYILRAPCLFPLN